MRRPVFALIIIAFACSPGESADSTTSSTSVLTTTTSTQPTTTTSPAIGTTTAVTATTTTTLSTTTTSTEVVAGNWADEPLVTVGFGALGWWDGSDWVDAESAGSLPVAGGEDYQVVRLNEVSRTTGGPQAVVCEPLELVGVELAEPHLLGDFPGPLGIAISAPWVVQPHLFEVISDDGSYAGFASELLADRGLEVADPAIKQVFRTDLEGDGVNEVLVVAEDVTQGFLMEPGDYSIAFLRKVVQDEVQTAVLAETVARGEDDRFAGAHSFGGVADLNGDGKMEVITNSAFFEGFDVGVWEYLDDDRGAVEVLEVGCGV